MKSFSQRKGIIPVSDIIQLNSMNDNLRNSLWNVLDVFVWSSKEYLYSQYSIPGIENFSQALWFYYFKKTIDSRPEQNISILRQIREYFFGCKWNEVYDFIEFVVNYYSQSKPRLTENFNSIMERELSGYRIVSGHVVDITSEQEIKTLEEAIKDTRFAGVATHLERALELFC